MFASSNDRVSPRQAQTLGASLLVHALLLVWLLHTPDALMVAPSSVAAGEYGASLTHLYWPSRTLGDGAAVAAANPKHSATRKLTWKKSEKAKKSNEPDATVAPDEAKMQASTANQAAPAAPAGMPYGTGGASFGDEIRPALPISATDPVVDPRDLAGHGEGNVIVEITIDDQGNIVQKVVVQSLGPVVDGKVLAALESWHFRPATRNGIAIPSKQDVYYHFKPNS